MMTEPVLVYEHGPVCPGDYRQHYIDENGEELYIGSETERRND